MKKTLIGLALAMTLPFGASAADYVIDTKVHTHRLTLK